MRVVFSQLALAELDEILSYVAQRNPLGAEHLETRLRRVLARIARHPQSAEEVAQRAGIRRLPLGRYPYVVYYEMGQDTVIILRILHGARRPPF